MNNHDVLIVGGGPSGLMLAGELALAGIDVAVLERRSNQDLLGARARGLHSRTIEILDQRGIADRFLAAGHPAQVAGYGWIPLDISDLPTQHPYGLALLQQDFERILAGWVRELGASILYSHEVTAIAQNPSGVDVELADGGTMGAAYLVGCDGGRSLVRKTAGIDFPGWPASSSNLIAEAQLAQEPEWGMRRDDKGIRGVTRSDNGKTVQILVTEAGVGSGEPTLTDLSEALIAAYGSDFGVHSPNYVFRFSDMARQASSYRARRILLAGDAAHVHSPVGGQGLNTGVQDAVNLGWKLAQVIKGFSPESLLDSYHTERHPVAARTLRHNLAQTALLGPGERADALQETMKELLAMDEPRRRYGAMMSGLDIHYDLGEGHPLLGRRMPDLDLLPEYGPLRLYTLLRQGKPVLLDLGGVGDFDTTQWRGRVDLLAASYNGAWELPGLGLVPEATAALIRPDGYVAWVGDGSDPAPSLPGALTRWFGEPSR